MKHELLAPAGDLECLKQAVANGADAVYCACENFGARKFAKNFTRDEMLYAIRLCHLYGVKIYVTMNTLVKDNEIVDFLNQVEFLYTNGVDAILIQDFGMFMLIRKKYPNLDLHISTQGNISSKDTCEFFYNLGAKRVVFSREMSLKEIESIKVPIEKEVFIHGALCSSYSGCCLMSSRIGGRSANRGECAGACRLPYTLEKNGQIIKENQYLLSLKELNTSHHFKELLDSSITSFKIEGRMKSPEYVGFVTRMYRKIIDNRAENIDLDKENDELKTIYNRGFTDGYLFESTDIVNREYPNHIGLEIGKVIEVNPEKIKIQLDKDLNQGDGIRFLKNGTGFIVNYLYDENGQLTNSVMEGDICFVDNKVNLTGLDKVSKTQDTKLMKELSNLPPRLIPVTFLFKAHKGEPITLEINDGEHLITVTGGSIEQATNTPTTEDRIREQIEKLGNTPFISKSTVVDVEFNSFIPIQEINELRRKAVNELIEKRMNKKKDTPIFNYVLDLPNTDKEVGTSVSAFTKEEVDYLSTRPVNRCYITNPKEFKDTMSSRVYYKLPRCSRNPHQLVKLRNLVGDYFDYSDLDNVVGDYTLNVTNIYSAYYLFKSGVSVVTPSVELNNDEIIKLINNYISTFKQYPRFEVVVYGRVENMLIKGNILDIVANDYKYYLSDKEGRKFPVYFDGENTHVLDYKNIEGINKEVLKNYVVLRYDFYDENDKEIKRLFNI